MKTPSLSIGISPSMEQDKFMLTPKPDITPYELACIWATCQMELRRDVFEKLPEGAKRHFEPSTYTFGHSH